VTLHLGSASRMLSYLLYTTFFVRNGKPAKGMAQDLLNIFSHMSRHEAL
jgi:hypothetical protein